MILQSRPPRDRRELLVCLTKTGPFSAQLMRLAEYALGHPDTMAFRSCSAIALSAGVSTSTVSRLAIALGFSSFRDLRDMFRDELRGIAKYRHVGADARHGPGTIAGL